MPAMSKEQERARRLSLISMYVLGIAVGCVLVGMLLQMKRAMLGKPPTPAPALQGAPVPPPGTP